MPRLSRSTPSVFDSVDDKNSSVRDSTPQNNESEAELITPPSAIATAGTPAVAAEPDKKPRPPRAAIPKPADDAEPVEWRRYAEKKAARQIDRAITYLAGVVSGTKTAVPSRVSAAEKILELGLGKNPSAAAPDKGRPMIKIFGAAPGAMRPGGANILPPDFEPPAQTEDVA